MTSETKVGLLLGLVFIFTIAFVINGLPSFSGKTDNYQLTVNQFDRLKTPSVDVRNQATKAVHELNLRQSAGGGEKIRDDAIVSKDVRYIAELPVGQVEQEQCAQGNSFADKAVALADIQRNQEVNSSKPVFYEVQPGDNLASIAKKFYGPEKGNKEVSVYKIFHANQTQLDSPDEVFAGQKLIIPPLRPYIPAKKQQKVASVFDSSMFEKVKSIGAKPLAMISSSISRSKSSREYIVQQGDSLWKIAEKKLGCGSRYSEIARANSDVLDDDDELAVGIRLKLPKP